MPDTFDSNGEIVSPEKVDEFTLKPVGSGKNCEKVAGGWGNPMNDYEYIWYGNLNEATYPTEACTPYYHKRAKIDYFQVINDITIGGTCGTNAVTAYVGASLNVSGTVTAATGAFTVKPFNIPHPTKPNMRLVHACLEGPENGVYIRGRLTNNNIIEVPDYWSGLVDPESITVTLTQIGSSQDLIVDKIEWGKKIYIKSGNASNIDCYYIVNATRKDVAPLPVEMGQDEEWPYKG